MIVGNLEIRLLADIARLQRDMNAGRQVVSNATAGMERAANAARTALASIGAGLIGGMGLSQIMRMTDEYTKFTAQLKLGTNSQKEYAQAMEDVKRISTAAQNDIGATGVLYARIIASTRELGVTQTQVAKVTETVNLALAATGAGSAESASAMLQLSQAFGSGVLRGEEFNAVYEAAPELLRILARSMGIPIGQLRKLAEEGKLTSDKLVLAFSDNQVINKLRENVAQITTFSGAMTVFKNNLTEVIGEQLHASGVVATFTSAILAGAGAIRVMLDVLVTATKVGAAYVALFIIAPPVITATAVAMTRLGHAMAVYAMNVMIGQANTIKFNQTLFGTSVAAGLAAGAITRVGLALNGVFALYLGWQIGKYLNDQFVEVEIAAEVMTGELLKAWEVIKFAFKDAFDAITLTAREGIAFLSRGMAGWFGLVADGMRLIGKTDAAAGVDKLAASVVAATEVQGTYTSRSAAARAEMEKNIKIIDLDTDRRSTAALAQRLLVGATDRGTEATAKATAAAVASAAAAKQQADAQKKAYEAATKAAQDFAKGMQQERDELGLNQDQLRMLGAARAAALAPTEALRLKIMETALALTLETKAWSDSEAARQAAENAGTEDSRLLLDINARIAATKQEIDLYGAGAAAVTAAEAAKVRALAGSMAISEQYREQLLLQADALDRLGEMQGVKSDLDALFDTGRVETFGEALRNAFGEAGSSMAQLGGALQEYVSKQANAEKDIAAVKLKYGKDDVRAARDIAKIQERMEADRIGAYGDMAGAAKGFFSEGTTGYKLMAGAEKAFRAVELASQMQSLYTHLFVTTAKATGTTAGQAVETTAVIAGETARNTAKVPGVFMSFMSALGPWGMAAAGVAIAAVLGGAFSGGGGGVDLSVQRQESQGTGSVLGSDDQSESIARALEAIEGVSVQGLAISNGMLASLRNIEAGIGQFASFLVRSTGVAGDFGSEFATKDGNFFSKLGSSIFGGKKTVEDTGFALDRTSFESILSGGVNASQYADIKKSGGWFSSSKMSQQLEGLGAEGNRQIASVLTSLYESVKEAGAMIGIGGDDFTAKLNSFMVDIGKVSLKGLTGAEIQEALSAVFSKVGDDLAAFGVDGLGPFQKVGEGYLETLSRVATNYQAVTLVTDSMGMTFNAVGLASVGARERLIDLVGGLDEFTSSADQFLADFYTDKERADSLRARITPTLEQFGIKTGAEDALQQFRSVVTGLDLTTESGARAYATLMQIAPAFKQIADVDMEALEKASDLARSKRELEIQIMELQGDAMGALAAQRADEMAEVDESLVPLYQRIYALRDERTAIQAAADAMAAAIQKTKDAAASLLGGIDSAFSALQSVANREKAAIQSSINVHAESVSKLQSLSQALRGTLDSIQSPDQKLAARAVGQAQISAALAIARAGGPLPGADSLKSALSAVQQDASDQFSSYTDYLRDLYRTQNDLGALAGLTDVQLSVEEKSLQVTKEQLAAIEAQLASTQALIDEAKGQSNTLLSIEQGIAGVIAAILAAQSNPVVAATSAINNAYQQHLGRAPDAAGFEWWKDAAASGTPVSQIVSGIAGSAEADLNKLYQSVLGRAPDAEGLSFWMKAYGPTMDAAEKADFLKAAQPELQGKKIPGFANGGDFGGGVRAVGEVGVEIEATGPSRIHSTQSLLDAMRRPPSNNNDALAAAVERLSATVDRQNAVIERQGAALEQIQRNTRRQADTLDVVTEGGNGMRVAA